MTNKKGFDFGSLKGKEKGVRDKNNEVIKKEIIIEDKKSKNSKPTPPKLKSRPKPKPKIDTEKLVSEIKKIKEDGDYERLDVIKRLTEIYEGVKGKLSIGAIMTLGELADDKLKYLKRTNIEDMRKQLVDRLNDMKFKK